MIITSPIFQLQISKFTKIVKQTIMLKSTILITSILLISIQLTYSRQIEVPAVHVEENINIKLNQIQTVNEPNFEFSNVFERKVFQADSSNGGYFEACKQNKPQVQFQIFNKTTFKDRPSRPMISYKFQDIKYSQFVLDVYYQNQTGIVYLLRQDATVAVIYLTSGKIMKNAHLLTINGLSPQTQLQLGYFLKISENLIFINNQFAISINENQAHKLEGYQSDVFFQTAVGIEDKFIAVAFEEAGVYFYKYTQNKLVFLRLLKPSQLSQTQDVQLSDLAYYSPQKSLLILDQGMGIISYTITINQFDQLQIQKGQVHIQKQLCSLMHLHQNDLYLVCDLVFRLAIQKFPKIQQTILPHPNIKIRQISVDGPLVAFVGRNVFRLMYYDRLVNFYKDPDMDKLIFVQDLFISANEEGVYFGKFNLIKPYITCQTYQQKMVGTHSLVFKTTAQCNQTYIKSIGINSISLGQYNSTDTCVYTVYRSVYFWRAGKLLLLPLIITFILFILIAFSVIIIWIIQKILIRRAQRQLDEYRELGGRSSVGKGDKDHKQLVQQQVPENNNNNNKSSSHNNDDDQHIDKKQSELQLQGQTHDIQ